MSTVSVPFVPLSVDLDVVAAGVGVGDRERVAPRERAVSSSVVCAPGTVFTGASLTSVTAIERSAGTPISSPSKPRKRIVRDGPGSSEELSNSTERSAAW